MSDEQQQMQDWYKQWKQAQITKDDDAGWRMEQRGFWAELLDLNRQGLRIAQEMQKQSKEAKETTTSRQPAQPATLYDLGVAGYWKSDNDAAWNPSAVQGSPSADRPEPLKSVGDPMPAGIDDPYTKAWLEEVRERLVAAGKKDRENCMEISRLQNIERWTIDHQSQMNQLTERIKELSSHPPSPAMQKKCDAQRKEINRLTQQMADLKSKLAKLSASLP